MVEDLSIGELPLSINHKPSTFLRDQKTEVEFAVAEHGSDPLLVGQLSEEGVGGCGCFPLQARKLLAKLDESGLCVSLVLRSKRCHLGGELEAGRDRPRDKVLPHERGDEGSDKPRGRDVWPIEHNSDCPTEMVENLARGPVPHSPVRLGQHRLSVRNRLSDRVEPQCATAVHFRGVNGHGR